MDYAQYFPVKKYLEGIRILGVTTQMKLSDFLMLPPITKTSDKTHFEIFLKLTLKCFFILYFKHCFKKCIQQIAGLFLLMLYFFLLHKNVPPSHSRLLRSTMSAPLHAVSLLNRSFFISFLIPFTRFSDCFLFCSYCYKPLASGLRAQLSHNWNNSVVRNIFRIKTKSTTPCKIIKGRVSHTSISYPASQTHIWDPVRSFYKAF